MKAKSDKFERFSATFCELSNESQNKLMKIAHKLLQAHEYAKQEASKQKEFTNGHSIV